MIAGELTLTPADGIGRPKQRSAGEITPNNVQTSSATTQAQIQGSELSHPQIHTMYKHGQKHWLFWQLNVVHFQALTW